MKKSIYVFILLAMFALCTFCACNSGSKSDTVPEITGIKELSVKIGEGTDVKLLEGVDVVLPDGSKVKPTIEKEGFDAQTAGEYTITYVYESVKASVKVYVYGAPKIYFNDTEILSDRIEITFGQALRSYNFVKGIKVSDSFGKSLTFVKSDSSADFEKKVGEYNVQYNAQDAVGNVLNKSVTFVVTAGNSPVVEDNGTYTFDIEGCKIPCDLKGETGGLLFDDDGELVNPKNYSFDDEHLILALDYVFDNLGDHSYMLETNEGIAEFDFTIIDDGKPIFDIENFANEIYIEGVAHCPLPMDKRPNSAGYTYEYGLKNSLEEDCEVIEKNGLLVFYNANDERLPIGDYVLTVTATNSDNQNTQMKYALKIIDLSGPAFKSSAVGAVEFDSDENITELHYNGGAVHTTPFSDTVWAGYLAAQEEGEKVMQFDIKFIGSATYNGHINNAATYMSYKIRGNRNFVRFYDSNGNEVNYSDLATNTWYKMMFDIDAIENEYGDMGTVGIAGHTGSSLRFGANIEGETIYVKNIEFVEKPAEAQPDFKSSVANAVNAYFDEQGENVTEVHYNGGAVHTTPFSDSVWEKYLAAQEEGGKVMRFDVKFAGSATYNGHINNAQTYMSTTIRGNRTYVRFYDAEGIEIAYTNLSVDTWYKMVFDIDAIKAQFGDMSTVSIAGHTGSSLRFGANIKGETIYVKNIDFVEKSAEIPSKPYKPDEPINPIGENDFDNVITDNLIFD